METSSSERLYKFDESFIELFKVNFLQRKSPTSPFEIRHVKLMSFATAASCLYTLCFIMRIVRYLQGVHMELTEVGQVGAFMSVYIISFCRATTLLVYRKKMRRLLLNLEKLFPVTREDQLKYHLHGYVKRIILRNRIMRTLASSGCALYYIVPILISSYDYIFRGQQYIYRYPLIGWHPFDDNRLLTYPFVYFSQMATSLIVVFFMLNDDFTFTTSVTYICMYYRHLGDLLSKLDARNEWRNHHELKNLIRYHYALEDLRYDVDRIFSLSTFIGFTILKTSLCLVIYAMFNGLDIIKMLPFTLSFLVLLIPTYLRCASGTELHDASVSLVDAMYDHNWYEGKPKHRKTIMVMMTRANRPALLHASRLHLISMEYYKEFVIQTYQIFMFLHNFST